MRHLVAVIDAASLKDWAPLLAALIALLGGGIIAVWTQRAIHANTLRRERIAALRLAYAEFGSLAFEFIELQSEMIMHEARVDRAVVRLQEPASGPSAGSKWKRDNAERTLCHAEDTRKQGAERHDSLVARLRNARARIVLLLTDSEEQRKICDLEKDLLEYSKVEDEKYDAQADTEDVWASACHLQQQWRKFEQRINEWLCTIGKQLGR